MSYFIILLLTIFSGISLASIFKKSFAKTIAFLNTAFLFVLYFCGLFARLDIGEGLSISLFLATIIIFAGLILFGKNKIELRESLINVIKDPITYLYLGFGILLGVLFTGKYTCTDWDELSHWGLALKNIFYYDNFGNLGDSTTMFNRYVPGTGIFMYGFTALDSELNIGFAYAAFDLLALSMLIPVADLFKKKSSWMLWISLGLIIGVPFIFKHNFAHNLLVDTILAIVMAYIYLCYLESKKHMDWFGLTSIALGLFTICCIKTSGMAVAIFAILLIIADSLFVGKESWKSFFKKKTNWILVLLPLIGILFLFLSWSIYNSVWNTREDWGSSVSMNEIIGWLTKPNEFQQAVNSAFWKKFWITNFYDEYRNYFTQPYLFVFLVYILVGVIIGLKTKNWKLGLLKALIPIISCIIYGIGSLYQYIFSFSFEESLRLASYSRYTQTMTCGMALVLIYDLIDIIIAPISNKQKDHKVLYALPIAGYVVAFIVALVVVKPPLLQASINAQNNRTKWIEAIEKVDKEDKIYYVMRDFNWWNGQRDYLEIRFFATPTKCSGFNTGGAYKDGRDLNSAYTGDPFEFKITKQELNDHLIENGYNYLYIDKVDEAFIEKFGGLFNEEPKAEVLYKINVEDGVVLCTEYTGE